MAVKQIFDTKYVKYKAKTLSDVEKDYLDSIKELDKISAR